jgi:hypothetical protein
MDQKRIARFCVQYLLHQGSLGRNDVQAHMNTRSGRQRQFQRAVKKSAKHSVPLYDLPSSATGPKLFLSVRRGGVMISTSLLSGGVHPLHLLSRPHDPMDELALSGA